MMIKKWITLCFIAGCLLSCETFQQNNKGDEVYYFPDKNVYYDVSRQFYLFSLDSGKTWDSLSAPEESLPAILGEKKVLYSNNAPVWAGNESHRLRYDGTLYNIVNDESLKPAVTETKTIARQTTKSSSKKEIRKRPIKKFFDKLFGKKKRDEE